MLKISWAKRLRNVDALVTCNEERSLIRTVRQRQAVSTEKKVLRNWLLKEN